MHTDLSAHLHSAECNIFIQDLKICHETKPFGRFLGACNELDTLMRQCLRNERKINQAANHQKALVRQDKYKERMQQQHKPEEQ